MHLYLKNSTKIKIQLPRFHKVVELPPIRRRIELKAEAFRRLGRHFRAQTPLESSQQDKTPEPWDPNHQNQKFCTEKMGEDADLRMGIELAILRTQPNCKGRGRSASSLKKPHPPSAWNWNHSSVEMSGRNEEIWIGCLQFVIK